MIMSPHMLQMKKDNQPKKKDKSKGTEKGIETEQEYEELSVLKLEFILVRVQLQHLYTRPPYCFNDVTLVFIFSFWSAARTCSVFRSPRDVCSTRPARNTSRWST